LIPGFDRRDALAVGMAMQEEIALEPGSVPRFGQQLAGAVKIEGEVPAVERRRLRAEHGRGGCRRKC
jgi:hypothetical protein